MKYVDGNTKNISTLIIVLECKGKDKNKSKNIQAERVISA